MQYNLYRLTGAAILGASLLIGAPAMAQTGQPAQGQQGQQGQAQQQDFSKDTLQKYVAAQADMQKIRQDFQQKAQQTQDRDAQNELRQQLNEELIKAVKSHDLTVEKFIAINKARQSNPDLARTIENMQN